MAPTPPRGRRLRIGIGGIAHRIQHLQPAPRRIRRLPRHPRRRAAGPLRLGPSGRRPRRRSNGCPWCTRSPSPAAPVEPAVYDALKAELIDRIRAAGPLDGLVYDIHGAMSVVGLEDAEADLTEAVRDAVGPDALISAAMDLHGNVSRRSPTALDLITATGSRRTRTPGRPASAPRASSSDASPPARAARTSPGCRCRCCCPARRPAPAWSPPRALYGRLAAVEALDGRRRRGDLGRLRLGRRAALPGRRRRDRRRPRARRRCRRGRWPASTGTSAATSSSSRPPAAPTTCIGGRRRLHRPPLPHQRLRRQPDGGRRRGPRVHARRLLANEDLASGRATAAPPRHHRPGGGTRVLRRGCGRDVTLGVGGKVDAEPRRSTDRHRTGFSRRDRSHHPGGGPYEVRRRPRRGTTRRRHHGPDQPPQAVPHARRSRTSGESGSIPAPTTWSW